MYKNTLIIGAMLFAIFFGAGNLIFPPQLGFESGEHFLGAMLGFVLTGVGLPLWVIIVGAYYTGGYREVLNRINPAFSLLFLMAIYLTIGPFFAIPRTGTTAYEIAILPFLDHASSLSLLLFSLVYYSLSLWLSLNPSKMVNRVGAFLTPLLLIAILVLLAKAVFVIDGSLHTSAINGFETENALGKGFLAGYQTMDVLAAIAFSVIVINAIKAQSETKGFIKRTALAAMVAAVALALIYSALGWLGNHYVSPDIASSLGQQHIGTYILSQVAGLAFGDFGIILLGVIITLACLTTSVGLIVSTSEYFHSIFPRISYRSFALIFTLIGFSLANQGLQAVIEMSVPVLGVLYPIAMSALLMLTLNIVWAVHFGVQFITLLLVVVISICSIIAPTLTAVLPLSQYDLAWLPFSLGGAVIGILLQKGSHYRNDE